MALGRFGNVNSAHVAGGRWACLLSWVNSRWQSLVWAVLALALAPAASAVTPYAPKVVAPLLEPWRWIHYPELNGEWVTSMVEGGDGAMWFRTRTGVMRYDGVQWQKSTSKEGLLSDEVTVLCAGADGTIYAGTDSGLCRYQRGRWQAVWPTAGTNRFLIRCLTPTADGGVWAGTDYGLVKCVEGSVTFYTTQTNQALLESTPQPSFVLLPGDQTLARAVVAAKEDRARALWAVAGENLLCITTNPTNSAAISCQIYKSRDGLVISDHVSAIYQAATGEIWTLDDSGNSGLNRFDGRKWTTLRLSQQFGGDDIYNSIWQTPDGILWISGFGRLFAYDGGQWQCYESGTVPVAKDRFCVLQTSKGDWWIAGRDSETWRVEYSGQRWITYSGLHFYGNTPDGRGWFVTGAGRVVVQEGRGSQWREYGPEDGLMDSATALIVTRQGEVWVGGSHQGVAATACFDGVRWRRKEHPELPYPVGYRSMFEATDGTLWFSCEAGPWLPGNRGGLLYCRRTEGKQEEWMHIGPDQEMKLTCVGIGQTSDGLLWLGGMPITQFDGKKTLSPLIPSELQNRWIDDVYSTPEGQLWLAVGGLGAYCRTGTNWVRYTSQEGLANNMVATILRLQDGTILAGNAKGVSRFDGRSWTPYALPPSLRIDREGGTLRQSTDGALWVNIATRAWYQRGLSQSPLTASDIALFRTTRYQPEHQAPVTRFSVFPQVVSQPGNTFLSWVAVDPWNCTAPDKLEYSFRLNQEEWTPFSTAASHYYLKMKSGNYRFQVRARDGDFNVEAVPAEVRFTVLAPVWQQGWFLSLMAAGVLIVGILEGLLIKRDKKIRAGSLQLSQVNRSLELEIQEHRRSQSQLKERTRMLEDEVEERKRLETEKDRIHKELLIASRQAGMAEVATSVLHNVGNVLNSVNVSVGLVGSWARDSRESGVRKLAKLMKEQGDNLGRFMAQDERGREIPAYLEQLAERLDRERENVRGEITGLSSNLDHIKEIVSLQQNYAQVAGVLEKVLVPELVEDALRFHRDAFARHAVKIIRDFAPLPPITVDRHKVLQILVNLLSNAKYACDAGEASDRQICVRIAAGSENNHVRIEVADNGMGIAPENLIRIFAQGFTTRKNGHGFGLHSSALTAKELGGSLNVRSDGPGKGAVFILELPRQPKSGSSDNRPTNRT